MTLTSDLIDIQVLCKHEEADGIASYELAWSDGTALLAFTPGVHVDVHVPGVAMRRYLLCNPSTETARSRIVMDRPLKLERGTASVSAKDSSLRLRQLGA